MDFFIWTFFWAFFWAFYLAFYLDFLYVYYSIELSVLANFAKFDDIKKLQKSNENQNAYIKNLLYRRKNFINSKFSLR